MNPKPSVPKLVIAISSSALFDMTECDRIYRQEGLDAYANYQRCHEKEPLLEGDAFNLVKKFLRINGLLSQARLEQGHKHQAVDCVEVILLSRNSADTGLRVFNSIQHHSLPIIRAAFTSGNAPHRYMNPFSCQLFLSTNREDVIEVLDSGLAAATILPSHQNPTNNTLLNFAFDGDAVIFSDEAEQVYQSEGLAAFSRSEQQAADTPLGGGPFKPFLSALCDLQSEFGKGQSPIRTALVTARSAPSHERVIKTLREWNIHLDESLFLGGMNKREFLRAYGADVFFDDQAEHCQSASEVVATGHVIHGVTNLLKS